MTARLPFTGNDEADALLSEDPLALLIGFALDQQVTVQKAFSGPWELRSAGSATSTPGSIAATDPGELDRVFRERPAIHRFPGSMAGKVAGARAPRSPSATTATPRGSGARRRTAATSRRGCSRCPASAR